MIGNFIKCAKSKVILARSVIRLGVTTQVPLVRGPRSEDMEPFSLMEIEHPLPLYQNGVGGGAFVSWSRINLTELEMEPRAQLKSPTLCIAVFSVIPRLACP